ncbi:MAG: hypothetical protein C5B53_03255 [Candidatus Melainabacteria bacterium]|nr:MAG: hypothetical protein C5B53_03255 [Candidatus Melainabacteria bacterium]
MSTTFAYKEKSFLSTPKITFGGVTVFEWQFVILGGMIFFLPLIMLLSEPTLAGSNPIAWYFWMNAIISMPHVNAAYVRLQRKVSEGKVNAFYGVPLYLIFVALLGVAACFGRYLEFMTAVNVWQSFHYVRQVYGVSRVYSHENRETTLSRRLTYFAYHLAMPLFVLGRWNVLFNVWKGRPSDVIIPVHMPDALMTCCFALAFVGIVLGLLAELLKFRQNLAYNPVGLITLLAYYAIHWFGFLSASYYFRGFFAVTIYHAVQYLGLVWLKEKQQRENPAAYLCLWDRMPVVIPFLAFWLLIVLIGSTFTESVIPTLNIYWLQWSAVLLGAQSAHHYAIDTFLWRAKVGK